MLQIQAYMNEEDRLLALQSIQVPFGENGRVALDESTAKPQSNR